MDRKTGLLDTRVDEDERRKKVQRWLGEKAVSFTLAETVKEYEEKTDAFEVRDYQLDAWANLWEARQAGKKRGLIHLATGLGKTSVGVFDVMKFREEQLAQDPPVVPRILFVSHMNDISEQAHERFKHFMSDLETEYFKTGRRNLPDADITFATFQSLHSELDRFDPQDFEYIIYDEAHHSEADTFRKVREHFDPLFELALTATPGRMDDRDIKEYFGEPLYSKTLAEGIAEGWLADVDYHIVFDDIVKQLMEEGFEPKTLKEFHEVFKVRPRNEVIAKNIREEQHKIGLDDAKTIVFCEDVAHAEEMAEFLGGIAYHSGIKKDERKNVLQDFRRGKSKVICTVDMFNEGIDIPDARLLVFLRSTQSGNIFEQQLGRGLRRAPGKDRVSVLDFVANIERIQKVKELSKAIRSVGDGESRDDKTIVDTFPDDKVNGHGDTESGLQIHTAHGEFDFNKMAVDLLEKYGSVKEGYTKEGLTEQLLRKAQELGRAPTIVDIEKDPSMPSTTPFYRIFDTQSWRVILEEVGLEHTINRYTKPQLTDLLLAKAKALGRAPVGREINEDPNMSSIDAYYTAFDTQSWNDVLCAVGLKPTSQKGYTKAELIEQLRRKGEEIGGPPSGHAVRQDSLMAGVSTFQKMFGVRTWQEVLEASEIDFPSREEQQDHLKVKLKNQLLQKARELGRTPKRREVDNDPNMASSKTFQSVFDTNWNGVIEAVGLETNRVVGYTKTQLGIQLRNKTQELGRVPGKKDIAADSNMASVETFKRVFEKSWEEVLKEVGLESRTDKFAPQVLIAQLQRKAEQLGRAPKLDEVDADPAMASTPTFKKVFKTDWNGVLVAAGLQPAPSKRWHS